MLITSLILENIKSYAREEVRFAEGLNAVCGENGSGKTTILEAFGYALFDFLPYNQSAFLREGAKSGAVRVRIVPSDGREYEVVRRVGGGGAWYVADVESGLRLAERGEAVLAWIRTHALGIEGETDLESLFKNAVGVPQGLMTADFLGSAGSRKAVFDPLLRVEEYRAAYEALRETRSYLLNLGATVNEEIARLETETGKLSELRAVIAGLQSELQASDTRVKALTDELTEVDRRRSALDEAEMTLASLRQLLSECLIEVERYATAFALQEEARDAARRARQNVVEAEAGYRRAVEAKQRLEALEGQRRECEKLEREIRGSTERLKGINAGIERLGAEVREAQRRAADAAGLAEAVKRQEELEGKLHDATMRLQVEGPLRARLTVLERELDSGRKHLGQLELAISEAREAQAQAERLPAVEEELRTLSDELAGFGEKRRRLADLEPEGRELRRQRDRLEAEVRRRQELSARIESLVPRAGSLEALLVEQQVRREGRVEARAAVEYQRVARGALERRHCPLLDLECPAISGSPTLLDGFDERVAALSARVPAIESDLARLDAAVAEARQAETELQALRLEAAKLEGSEALLAEVEGRLRRCREDYAALTVAIKGAPGLERRREELHAEEAKLRKLAAQASQIEVLTSQLEREQVGLEERRRELESIRAQIAALDGVHAEIEALQRELSELANPRERQQSLLVIAGRLPQLQAHIEAEQRRLQDESDRFRALVGQKQKYQSVDGDIETQAAIVRDSQADHDRYLQYQDEAGSLEARELAAARTHQLLERARKRERECRERLDVAERQYDPALHTTLKERCAQLGQEIAAENTNRAHLERTLLANQEQLAYLERQEVRLGAARLEKEELERAQETLGFIRETVKLAGPAVTETLLRNISQVANDVFAEIMDDHAAELRWDREYEILLQRGAETRKFAQLSGGEQMSAALAVRLALLKEMSEVDVAFFDEPTQNMDVERRGNLAGQIRQVRGFKQLIVISHDDTFEHDTDNLIRLHKVDGVTTVVA